MGKSERLKHSHTIPGPLLSISDFKFVEKKLKNGPLLEKARAAFEELVLAEEEKFYTIDSLGTILSHYTLDFAPQKIMKDEFRKEDISAFKNALRVVERELDALELPRTSGAGMSKVLSKLPEEEQQIISIVIGSAIFDKANLEEGGDTRQLARTRLGTFYVQQAGYFVGYWNVLGSNVEKRLRLLRYQPDGS